MPEHDRDARFGRRLQKSIKAVVLLEHTPEMPGWETGEFRAIIYPERASGMRDSKTFGKVKAMMLPVYLQGARLGDFLETPDQSMPPRCQDGKLLRNAEPEYVSAMPDWDRIRIK